MTKRFSFFIMMMMMMVMAAGGLAACSNQSPAQAVAPASPTPAWTPSATTLPSPTLTATPAATATPVATPTPAPRRVFLGPGVPDGVRQALQQAVFDLYPDQFSLVDSRESAELQLAMSPAGDVPAEETVATWVYALVAPFPTLVDEVPFAEVQAAWFGSPSPTFPAALLVSPDTYAALAAAWGEAAPGAVELVEAENLVDALWATRPAAAWGIVPFGRLSLRLKTLAVDGLTPLHRNLDGSAYPLALAVGLGGDPQPRAAWQAVQPPGLTNRDESKMTILAMTGVTALTRTTAWKMEHNGILYPAEKIRSWLTDADLVHISNEVSFWEQCPPPGLTGMEFCSAPKYMQIITDVHTSIIELTGNHVNDYGWEPMSYTLGLYDQLQLPYYGGGRTVTEAQRAVTLTHNGNVLGFVGCNPVGPPGAWVNGLGDGRPGAARCDDAVLATEIQSLQAAGAIPVATLQYWEFYHYTATAQQVSDFRELVDYGAAIVNGSQGHHPQGFDFYGGGFIHYGVGNLFFGDQFEFNAHKMFVDRYLIYQGRVLNVELLTGFIEDYSQARPMTPDERREFLQTVFAASVW